MFNLIIKSWLLILVFTYICGILNSAKINIADWSADLRDAATIFFTVLSLIIAVFIIIWKTLEMENSEK